ncbi:MAG: FG-GAP repeat protein, partial [Candidatus Saccharimonadales bacterium]
SLNGSTGVNGTNGFSITNTGAGGSGIYMASGDINGDTIADAIIGAPYATHSGLTYNGSAFVIFGSAAAWPASVNLASLNGSTGVNGTNGVRIDGATPGDQFGSAVAAADVNGDGVADLIIGADYASYNGSQAGSTYALFGSKSTWPASMTVSTNGTTGIRLDGAAAGDRLGIPVCAGDVNGDGIPDIITSAVSASPPEGAHAGSTYVYYGKKSGWPATAYNLGNL